MRKTIRFLLVMGLILLMAPSMRCNAQNGSIDGYISSGGTSVYGVGGLVGSIGEPVVGLLRQDWQHFLQGFAYKTISENIVTSTDDLLSLKVRVKLYPNPVVTDLNIEYEGLNDGSEKYMICDDGGRLVESGSLAGYLTRLDVAALRPGVYIFTLINNLSKKKIFYQKFVKYNL